jgi:hypothetical protein
VSYWSMVADSMVDLVVRGRDRAVPPGWASPAVPLAAPHPRMDSTRSPGATLELQDGLCGTSPPSVSPAGAGARPPRVVP